MSKIVDKAKERLKKVVQNANPLNGLLSMAGSYAPKLREHLEAINKPAAEGGLLKEGQDRITYLLTTQGEELILSIVPLIKNKDGQFVLDKPLRNLSLQDLLNGKLNGETDGDEA